MEFGQPLLDRQIRRERKQILLNYGYSEEQLSSEETIDYAFSRFSLEACTNNPDFVNHKMSNFTTLDGGSTRKYFKFDIYVSIKASGPAYVPGSKNKNALWIDRILLLTPEQNSAVEK